MSCAERGEIVDENEMWPIYIDEWLLYSEAIAVAELADCWQSNASIWRRLPQSSSCPVDLRHIR